jgi:hypothetical protein
MASFVVAGGFGAVINCALASYFSSQFDAVQEIFLQPAAALKTLVCGFFGGTLVLLMWQFVKVRMVRYLFQYDGWFLHPKRPINKVSVVAAIAKLCLRATSFSYSVISTVNAEYTHVSLYIIR